MLQPLITDLCVSEPQLKKISQATEMLQPFVADLCVFEIQQTKLSQTTEMDQPFVGGIVNCCVLRNSLSGGFLHDTVFEGTSFDDECDLFVAA